MTEQQLAQLIEQQISGVRADLDRLVRVPSVAFPGFDHTQVERSANLVAELLRGVGLPEVAVVRAGGQPAVIGRSPAPPGAPTVMLYAHHDVQPAGDLAQWRTDPFEPAERHGRLIGRGAADDKAGVMVHVAALRALRAVSEGGTLPVGVMVVVEGEEEAGSASLERLLREHCQDGSIAAIVVPDAANWACGRPALTTGLRGCVNVMVEVRTLDHALHSGFFGGPIPDALTTLCRLLATLHDDAGNVAVAGLTMAQAAPLDYPVHRFRAESGLLDGVELTGTGPIVERLWTKPAIAVLGIDAPSAAEAPSALVPVARARVSLRIAPGDEAAKALTALTEHCERHVSWGARLTVTPEHAADPCVIDARGHVYDVARDSLTAAWDGTSPVDIGMGASIPFVATLQELFPGAAVLVTGVEDPDSRAHGPNESLHLADFQRLCHAEALLLWRMGMGDPSAACAG